MHTGPSGDIRNGFTLTRVSRREELLWVVSLIAATSDRLWGSEFEVERCRAICGRRRNGAVAPACGRGGDLILYTYIGQET